MSMMDLASALRGGPGGAPPGLDPEDLREPPERPGEKPDAEDLAEGPEPGGSGGGEIFSNSMEALDVAEHAIHAFIHLDPDDSDRAQATKALQIVIGLKGAHQKSVAAGDMKSLSRALSGAQSFTGGPRG